MTLAADPKTMSIEEFVAHDDLGGYELIEGVLTERKTMGALADYVAQQLSFELVGFCRQTNAGYVFGAETTYRCFGDPETGRRADVSFIRRGRLPDERIPEGVVEIPADLAVEVVSPRDTAYRVAAKAELYLRFGFGEVWLVYPNLRAIHVYRKGEPILSFNAEQALTGRGPLEGFSCPVARLFPQPAQA